MQIAERSIPIAGFPNVAQAIEDLGDEDDARAAAMDCSTKTVRRLRHRLPAALKPFLCSPSAESLLLAALADVRKHKTRA